jgi:hypothetical protein
VMCVSKKCGTAIWAHRGMDHWIVEFADLGTQIWLRWHEEKRPRLAERT